MSKQTHMSSPGSELLAYCRGCKIMELRARSIGKLSALPALHPNSGVGTISAQWREVAQRLYTLKPTEPSTLNPLVSMSSEP